MQLRCPPRASAEYNLWGGGISRGRNCWSLSNFPFRSQVCRQELVALAQTYASTLQPANRARLAATCGVLPAARPAMLASLRGRPLVRPLLGRAARCCVTTTGGTKAPKLDVLAKAESHGIRLSATERALIERDLGRLGPGEAVTGHEWEILVRERAQRQAERQLLLQYVGRVTEDGTHAGQHALRQVGLLGVIFFSITGTHAAGEAGMHVLGATLVGCVTAIGGGTLNGAMLGATPVGWMVQPRPLVAAVVAGVLTFYLLPLAARAYDDAESANPAAPADPATPAALAPAAPAAVPKAKAVAAPAPAAAKKKSRGFFGWGASKDDDDDDRALAPAPAPAPAPPAPPAPPPSPSLLRAGMFGMESLALAAFAVVGAQAGITRGMPPATSVVLGVTIAFGQG